VLHETQAKTHSREMYFSGCQSFMIVSDISMTFLSVYRKRLF